MDEVDSISPEEEEEGIEFGVPELPPILIYCPSTSEAFNLASLTKVRILPPKELDLPMKEVKTKEPRKTHTEWRCDITLKCGSEIHLRKEEAELFFELIKPSLKVLGRSE